MSKYLTKEDLELIAGNPTFSTIESLYNKYKSNDEVSEVSVNREVDNNFNSVPINGNTSSLNVKEPVTPVPPLSNTNNASIGSAIPSFELPKVDTPVVNNNSTVVNTEPLAFNGNLFDTQSNQMNGLMQTTDNFGRPPVDNANNSVNVQNTNSNIPVYGNGTVNRGSNGMQPTNQMGGTGPVQQTPTMFGQLQSNYTRAA